MKSVVADLIELLDLPTRGLAPARARYRDFYDDWLKARRLENGPTGFIHAVVSTFEELRSESNSEPPIRIEDTRDSILLSLAALKSKENILACFSAAISAGLFDSHTQKSNISKHRNKIMKAIKKALGLKKGQERAVLQATVNPEAMIIPDAYWTDPGEMLPAIILGRRRLCKIIARNHLGNKTCGTGFLIGPSSVLTCWHVVKDVVSEKHLKVQFDFSDTTGLAKEKGSVFSVREDWLLYNNEIGSTGPDEDYWWDDFIKREEWLDQVKDSLDYAVIQLDGSPGLQRGWYKLSTDPIPDAIGAWALHHPSAEQHTLTTGPFKFGGVDDPHHIFHTAPTVVGSSGGLILDERGKLAGLHYLGITADADPVNESQINKQVNVAVTVSAIARDLDSQNLLDLIEEPTDIRPFRGCIDGRRPVFGRNQFLADLQEFWEGNRHMMRIEVEEAEPPLNRPGKSYSADIIKGIFSGPEHHHILFRAGDIKVDAHKVATDALKTFAEDLVPQLPDKADTTTPAYVKRLVSKFGEFVGQRLQNQTVWIVLDDLEKHSLSDASGREFLATLYNQIEQIENLRIVLIGLPADISISGLREEDVIRSTIEEEDLLKLKDRFIDWLKERGARDEDITDTGYSFIAEILSSVAGDTAPLHGLSEFVENHVTGAADSFFGTAKPTGGGEQ